MPRRGKRMGSDAAAFQEPSDTVASDTARMRPERTALGECVKTAVTVSLTESEIAAVAYQLWVDNGCTAGSDQEDWYRAEAMLKVQQSPSAILAPSLKCWLRYDGGYLDIGRYGKANGAVPAGSGMRPLQALEFLIEQPERDSRSQTRSPRGKFCLMDGRNCAYQADRRGEWSRRAYAVLSTPLRATTVREWFSAKAHAVTALDSRLRRDIPHVTTKLRTYHANPTE